MEVREFAEEINARLEAAGENKKRPNDMGKLLKKYEGYLNQLGIHFLRTRSGGVAYEFTVEPVDKQELVTLKSYCEDCAHHSYNLFGDCHHCEAHDLSFDPKGREMTGCNEFRLKPYDWEIAPLTVTGREVETEKLNLEELLRTSQSSKEEKEPEYGGYESVY